MTALFATLPLMVLAFGAALAPLVFAMRNEARWHAADRSGHARSAPAGSFSPAPITA